MPLWSQENSYSIKAALDVFTKSEDVLPDALEMMTLQYETVFLASRNRHCLLQHCKSSTIARLGK